MRILVTGSTGFIGSHVCEALIGAGHEVVGLTLSGEARVVQALRDSQCFSLVQCDLSKPGALETALVGSSFDAVVHLAAKLPATNNLDALPFVTHNVVGTVNLLSYINANQISKLILSSSMSVYGVPEYVPVDEQHPTRPYNIYGLTKLEAEWYAKLFAQNSDLHVIVLRYSGVYGSGQTSGLILYLLKRFLENQPVELFSRGQVVKDYVYVKDVVKANLLAVRRIDDFNYEVFNIGSGVAYRTRDITEIVRTCTSSNADIKYVDTEAPRNFTFFFNIEKARQQLGYQPTPFQETIEGYLRRLKGEPFV